MIHRFRLFSRFFICVFFFATTASSGSGAELEQVEPYTGGPPLEASTAALLRQAAVSEESGVFERAVREALSRDPRRSNAILRLAIALKPDWAAAQLGASLRANEVQPESGAHHSAATHSGPPEPDAADSDPSQTRAAPIPGAVALAPLPAPGDDGRPEPTAAPAKNAPPNPAFAGSVDLGGILRTGNTENAGVKGQLKLSYKPDRWEHKGKAEASYLRSEAETLEQRAVLEYEVNYDMTDRVFVFGLANYTDDRFSGFDFETLSSAGLGVRLFEGAPVTWEVTAGPSLRYAEFSDSGETETAPGARFTNDISWQVSEGALLANETEVLWDRERVTLENDASLKLRIVEKLSGKLSLNTRYRSNVPEDTESTDTTTRASIVYDF